ncbi:MAG TPA: acyl-CoA dehydrogenase family protein, partial [Acidimicrobiales bacterium]
MDLSLTEEQDAVAEAIGRFLDKASSAEQVRAAEPLGWDRAVWDGFVQMGVPTMGVAEGLGGGGSTLGDLAVVAEAAGAHLASAPIVEAMVAARLLAEIGDAGAAWLGHLAEGGGPVTIALRPAVDGVAGLVPGAAVADAALVLDGDDLVAIV